MEISWNFVSPKKWEPWMVGVGTTGCALTLVCSSMTIGIRPQTSENWELLVLFD